MYINLTEMYKFSITIQKMIKLLKTHKNIFVDSNNAKYVIVM